MILWRATAPVRARESDVFGLSVTLVMRQTGKKRNGTADETNEAKNLFWDNAFRN